MESDCAWRRPVKMARGMEQPAWKERPKWLGSLLWRMLASFTVTKSIGHWELGYWDHCSDLVGHYILGLTGIMHSGCSFHTSPASTDTYHTNENLRCLRVFGFAYFLPGPFAELSTRHPPPPTQLHVSVLSRQAVGQAGPRHPLNTGCSVIYAVLSMAVALHSRSSA